MAPGYGARVDTPIWVTILVAVLTAGGSYFAGIRPARIAAEQAKAALGVAQQQVDDNRERFLVERVDKAWELCRTGNRGDRRVGIRYLRALIQEPGMPRLVSNILQEVADEEFGQPYANARHAYIEFGVLPDVDIYVEAADDDDQEVAGGA